MHGNSSSRLEALEAVTLLLSSNITLFCFDFAGCGLSEGEYISLGWYERDDLNQIVEYLRKERRVSTIGLWGRSMGAATALLHGDRDPSIAGMVLDSSFSDLKVLCEELAKFYAKLPGFIISGALALVKSTIKSKAKFDIFDLKPIAHVENAFIPALFATAIGDDFVKPHHTE
jgi:pimeloyl-ACP methyl ester carboxylesterase